MSAVVIPRCGRIGCDLDQHGYPDHKHDDFDSGDRIVATPKRPAAPGWVFACPAATVVTVHGEVATIVLDDGTHRQVATDLLTRWHTWRRRKVGAKKARKMPRPSRLHRIDPEFGVAEPPLFGDNA